MQRFGQSVGNVKEQIDRTAAATSALTASFARMGHFTAGALGLREIGQASDSIKDLDARLQLFEKSSEKAASAFKGIFAIAQETGSGLEDVADLYGKFARNADVLNLSQERTLGITRTITQAMAVAGGASASAQAAIVQFGQGLASGVLRGDELRSVMEQAPALADAIARGMGRTTSELKTMGEQGLITVSEIIAALEKMRGEIESQFALMPQTIGRALTRIRNEYLLYVKDSEAIGVATNTVVAALSLMMRYFDEGATAAGLLAAVMAGRYAAAKVAAARATLEQVQAEQAARAAAVESTAVALRRAQAEQQAALIAQSRAREAVAAAQVEAEAANAAAVATAAALQSETRARQAAAVAAAANVRAEIEGNRERLASSLATARQEIAARWAQFAETKLIIQQEIALEKVRLQAQINDIGRTARLRELAALSQQLSAVERQMAEQSSAIAKARAAEQAALAQQDARIAKARQVEQNVITAQDAKIVAARVAGEKAVEQAATAGSARVVAARTAETAATEAAAAATLGLRGAQAAATTATAAAATGVGVFGAAIAALGGPVGALITVLSLAGAAWFAFGNSAETAGEKALATAKRVEEAKQRIDRQKKFGSGDAADFREEIQRLEALIARDEKLLEANASEPDPDFMAVGVTRRLAQTRALLEENRRYLDEIEKQEGAIADGIAGLGGAAWRRFMENSDFATAAQKDLQKFNDLSKAYVAAIAEIRKAKPDGDPLATPEGMQALERYKAKLQELQAEMQKTAIASQQKLRDALVDAMQDGAAEAKKLKVEIADLLAKAAAIRAGVAGAGAKAQDRRDRGLSDADRETENYRRAKDALDEAERQDLYARNAALDGRAEKAQEHARRAAEFLAQASAAADKLQDNDSATVALFERIAEAEASALETEAAQKQRQMQDIQAQAAAQAQELSNLEARIAALKGEAATVHVQAETTEAMTGIEAVKTAVEALPDLKVIEIEFRSTGTAPDAGDLPGIWNAAQNGFAGGGWTGSGNKYDVAGLVHAEEFVNRREVVRQPGARNFLELFNRVGMRALEIWRNGYASGGLVQRLRAAGGMLSSALGGTSLPVRSGLGGDAIQTVLSSTAGRFDSDRTPLVLDFGPLGRYETSAAGDVAEGLQRTLRMAVLRRGSRR